ncbi:MAG: hypothetical protein HZA36_02390 [Parcubacteria group bacterium]|nr:hypothetical protein [Parcubacteria group bacterium]
MKVIGLKKRLNKRFPGWRIVGRVTIPKDPKETFMVTVQKDSQKRTVTIAKGKITREQG